MRDSHRDDFGEPDRIGKPSFAQAHEPDMVLIKPERPENFYNEHERPQNILDHPDSPINDVYGESGHTWSHKPDRVYQENEK